MKKIERERMTMLENIHRKYAEHLNANASRTYNLILADFFEPVEPFQLSTKISKMNWSTWKEILLMSSLAAKSIPESSSRPNRSALDIAVEPCNGTHKLQDKLQETTSKNAVNYRQNHATAVSLVVVVITSTYRKFLQRCLDLSVTRFVLITEELRRGNRFCIWELLSSFICLLNLITNDHTNEASSTYTITYYLYKCF